MPKILKGTASKIKINDASRRAAERILGGYDLQYDKDLHPALLIELFSVGLDLSSFCSQAEIGRTTFYDWIQKHPEFKHAYEISKEKQFEFFERKGIEGINDPTFNQAVWAIQMKNKFGYTTSRKVRVAKFDKANTSMEQFAVLREETSEGNFTAGELTHLASFVAIGAKIEEFSVIKRDVEELKEAFLNRDKV